MEKKWIALFGFITILGILAIVIFQNNNLNKIEEEEVLTILWAEWKPADYLQELTNDFTEETGIKINIIQDSWGTWQDLFFEEMEKKGGAKFDMVIGDSQWLGKGSQEGHYIELTKWMENNDVSGKFTDASIEGYSRFPKGSEHYWAIPVEGDAMGFSYRKDLFENPKEKEAFFSEYGYELNVPKTWNQLKDIAEFFYRPESDFYGVLIWTEPDYDGITMGIDALLWSWGSELGNIQTYEVGGILNSKEGIDALEFYKDLNQYNNPEWSSYYLDTKASSNQPMIEGKVAMSMGYFAINPELLDKEKNPNYYDKIGFFASPKGPAGQYTSLGGQGISIVSYTKKKDAALKFLEWFVRDDVQKKWGELGGLSCNKNVLYSEEFLDISPINKPFVESIEIVKDFWAVPEYADMLKISQKYWYEYVVEDKITSKEAMDNIAREWENIFEINGYYRE